MKRITIAILVLGLAMLACATVTVTNLSQDNNAVIQVTLPDEAYGTTKLNPGESIDYLATTGGAYSVEVIPDQEYLAWLQTVRGIIVTTLAADPSVAVAPHSTVLEQLVNVQDAIRQLPHSGTNCSGSIPNDTPDNYTIEVSLSYDAGNVQWSCTATAGPG